MAKSMRSSDGYFNKDMLAILKKGEAKKSTKSGAKKSTSKKK